MRLKRRFDLLHDADDKALSRMAQYPAMDEKRMERLYTQSMEKYEVHEEETFTVQEVRRPQWTRAALVAACLVICGTAAAGIGALGRMAPPPEDNLTAEVTPAASAEVTAYTETTPETEATEAPSETAAALLPTETTVSTKEHEIVHLPDIKPEPDQAQVFTPVEETAPAQGVKPVFVETQGAGAAETTAPVQTVETQTEAVQETPAITASTENEIPGFTVQTVSAPEVRPEMLGTCGDTVLEIRAVGENYPTTLETLYIPSALPENYTPKWREGVTPVDLGSLNSFGNSFSAVFSQWNEYDATKMLNRIDFQQKTLDDSIIIGGLKQKTPEVTPTTVNGHPGVIVSCMDIIGDYKKQEFVDCYVNPSCKLIWQDGTYLYMLGCGENLTVDDLYAAADSLVS